jgi:hypothetical protein
MRTFRRTRSVSSPALEQLLADAAAPAHAGELTGLAAALTAFAQAPTPRRTPMKSALAALLTAKALAATAGAAAVGGVALAAATGTLPGTASPHTTTPPTHPSEHASATPSPSLVGLCRAYQAGVKDAHGKALESAAFSVLTAAAGGADKVDAYCTTVLATAPGGRPTSLPTQATDHPTGKPSDHPTGKPADVPPSHPGKPADVPPPHPTGSPSVVPPVH